MRVRVIVPAERILKMLHESLLLPKDTQVCFSAVMSSGAMVVVVDSTEFPPRDWLAPVQELSVGAGK